MAGTYRKRFKLAPFMRSATPVAALLAGVISFFVHAAFAIPPELSWAFVGLGLGGILADIQAVSDRDRAEANHREQIQIFLATMSGTTRQAFRIGSTMAEMLSPHCVLQNDEHQRLLANAKALGIDTALEAFIGSAPRRLESARDLIVNVRSHRGGRVTDGMKVGFELQMLANYFVANTTAERFPIEEKTLFRLRDTALERFPLDDIFKNWIVANLTWNTVAGSQYLPVIRQTQYILWQSRHLQKEPSACGCIDTPCERRLNLQRLLGETAIVTRTKLSEDFTKTLRQHEDERRTKDLEELKTFAFYGTLQEGPGEL